MQTSPKQLGPAREEAAAPWSSCRALLGNPPLGSAKLPRQERRRGASRGAPQPYHCCEWAARSESWPPATGLRHQARGTVSRPKTGTKPPRVKSRAPDPVVIFQTSRGRGFKRALHDDHGGGRSRDAARRAPQGRRGKSGTPGPPRSRRRPAPRQPRHQSTGPGDPRQAWPGFDVGR